MSTPTFSGRRLPPAHANRFDSDAMPSVASVNTSISSVSTEPHTTEPTPRRRVASPPAPIFDAMKPPHNTTGGSEVNTPLMMGGAPNGSSRTGGAFSRGTSPNNTTVGSPVRKNNPYLYNVLGDYASPDFASRTSPIPPENMSPCTASPPQLPPAVLNGPTANHHQQQQQRQRSHSFDWEQLQQHQQQHASEAAGGGAGPTVLGSYMAQCYSSVFPPGKLPTPSGASKGPAAAAAAAAGSSNETGKGRATEGGGRATRRNRRGGSTSPLQQQQQQQHNSSTATVATPASPTTVAPPPPPPQPRAVTPSSADDASPMTRVYRNGRPVPVPTAASATR